MAQEEYAIVVRPQRDNVAVLLLQLREIHQRIARVGAIEAGPGTVPGTGSNLRRGCSVRLLRLAIHFDCHLACARASGEGLAEELVAPFPFLPSPVPCIAASRICTV